MTDFLQGFQSTKTVAMTEHKALTSSGKYLEGKIQAPFRSHLFLGMMDV